MKEYTQHPQNKAYQRTCETCTYSTPHKTLPGYVNCTAVVSKHYDKVMGLKDGCTKHREPDTRTPSLFGDE